MKTEPNTYSWDDLVRDTAKNGGEEWSGVRNYTARNHMRTMEVGDLVFIYHSVKETQIVGIATVVRSAHQDSTDDSGVWQCVDVASVEPFKRPVTLKEIKSDLAFTDMALVKYGRLSVQPVTVEEWHTIIAMQ